LPVAALAGVAAGLAMGPLMAGLHGTDQPPFTILRGDMTFRTEYVTRFADDWRLHDFTLGGLSAFYPPAWFWLAGRTAHYLDIAPWRIVKPFTIGTAGVALLAAHLLWRRVLTPAGALSAAIGSSLVLTTQVGDPEHATLAWYSSYSCFVAVVGVAWLAATLATVRAAGGRGRLVVLALVGALLALSYYLLFTVLALALAALVAVPDPGRRRSVVRAGAVCGVVGLLTAEFWLPLVGAVLSGAAAQGHYLVPDFLHVSVGLNGAPALVVLAVVGLAALVLTLATSASRAVVAVLAGAVLYQLASVATLLIGHDQLEPHRAVTMLWAALGAAVPVALEGFRDPRTLARALPAPALRAVALVAVVLAVPATFVLGSALGTDLATGPLTTEAFFTPDLSEARAASAFIRQTTGRPADRLTLLTDDHALLVTEPYHGFLPLRARYAHPEADIPGRLHVLWSAAACPDPACATRALTDSRFGPIDAMILTPVLGGYRLDTQVDGFPDPAPVSIVFPRERFDPADWARRQIGEHEVFARR
jgi:galactan 5-O-arabinofuranosyltransferase